MVNKLCRRVRVQLFLRKNIRVADINRSVRYLFEAFTGTTAVYCNSAVRIRVHKLLCRCLYKRKQS